MKNLDIHSIINQTFKPALYILIVLAIAFLLIKIVWFIRCRIKERNERRRFNYNMKLLVNESPCLSAEDFLLNADMYENYVGVYVVRNVTRDLYYVGQATRTVDRLKSHLQGRGNGDVYADYKYGDEMYVSIIPYDNSQGTLNDMEANFIEYFDACDHGYNKTHGNHH